MANPTEASQPYASFQTELYTAGIIGGIKPAVTTDPNLLEEQAKAALPPRAFNYVGGGAGERATMDANRQAFRSWKLVPRMLRDTRNKKLGVELFGVKYGERGPYVLEGEGSGANVMGRFPSADGAGGRAVYFS